MRNIWYLGGSRVQCSSLRSSIALRAAPFGAAQLPTHVHLGPQGLPGGQRLEPHPPRLQHKPPHRLGHPVLVVAAHHHVGRCARLAAGVAHRHPQPRQLQQGEGMRKGSRVSGQSSGRRGAANSGGQEL